MEAHPKEIPTEQSVIDQSCEMDREVLAEVGTELSRARWKFGDMAGLHEAYAVILEEVDEFWEGVKAKGTSTEDLRAELVQIAAMAVRAITDCCS